MQTSQVNGGQLETHLRNLILSNSSGTDQPATRPLQAPVASTPPERKPEEGQTQAHEKWQSPSQPPTTAQASPRTGKKRPNQAQRRQMQAELSIPIDTRAPAPHDTRPYPNSHQYNGQHAPRHNAGQNVSRPHPGAYHGGFQDRADITSNAALPHQRRHQNTYNQAPMYSPNHQPSWRHQQNHQPQSSFDAFSKGVSAVSADAFPSRGHRPSQHSLYNPGGQRQFTFSPEQIANQTSLLDQLCHAIIMNAEIEPSEIEEKENFRAHIEAICRDVINQYEVTVNGILNFQPHTVQLKCFGSLASGFATKTADMDLGLLSPMSQLSPDSPDSPIPRLVEKALLENGFGARLLTRTRVPIIKLCERPHEPLRRDLLEARARWEKGLADDVHEAVDDAIDEHDVQEHMDAMIAAEVDSSPLTDQKRNSNRPSGTSEKTYGEQLASLKQMENQSLLAYYGNAKRLLRRLNGRDITVSSAASFTVADYKVLDDVCWAFVNGLNDDTLRSRVQSYPSFRPGIMPKSPNWRSLLGAFTIVDGEKLVMLLEVQATIARHSKFGVSSKTIQAWKALHNKREFGTDPLLFNREVHVAIERLRQIPLAKLLQLRQDQYESPIQYHARAAELMAELTENHPSPDPTLVSQVVEHYVSGIRDKQVREEVEDFARHTEVKTLRTIAKKHKIVHLVADYKRAIEKDFYSGEQLPVIEEYVAILQNISLQQVAGASDLIVPATGGTITLIEKIRQLPNPSKLSPNQPRDRYHDSLEFPKNGVGVQCDINFSAHLALQNTLLLRCYSSTDPRVRPMVLFVKHWAKARGINTPYRGTLSSYGYVLMVLHYLINVAEPFVCPNLQQLAPPDPNLPAEALEGITTCRGRNVRFWRDEQEIQRLASLGQLNQNRESVGSLLRGFFEYYAQSSMMSTVQKRGFDWGRDVLSLRTHGGLLSKQEKGWTGAKTVVQFEGGAPPNPAEAEGNVRHQVPTPAQTEALASPDGAPATPMGQSTKPREVKEVRHRFLFAIEDPFEHEHNVARTVTHNGIVSIRDEFRRAWRIIRNAGRAGQVAEDLLEDVKVENEKLDRKEFDGLLEEIHGQGIFLNPVAI
ncbi:ribose-phosphate pyrophosphokinase 1 [Hypoxylon texense]